MLHLRGDEVMNDTLPLPFLCTRRARGYKTMRSRLFPGPTEGDVLPRLNSSSFQRARLCILPSLAIPRIRLAASLPPQIESFPGSLGLLKAPVTYFWTPDHEAQDTHLTERGAGQSPPGCAWAAPPQQAVAPGPEVAAGADTCRLPSLHPQCVPGTMWDASQAQLLFRILTTLTNTFAGKGWRHRLAKQTWEHSGGRRGWDQLEK